jgi:site-specific DNA-methyltransferase (adenine-specific)
VDGANSVLLPPGGKTQTDVWATPRAFFDELNREFRFTVDVCASASNAKCARYYDEAQDGLAQDWSFEVAFMNPPYSDCAAWMRKAQSAAARDGATVVCLVPVRTDTAWWHDFAMKGEVRFVRGRLKFGTAKTNAPFPSAVVVFRP